MSQETGARLGVGLRFRRCAPETVSALPLRRGDQVDRYALRRQAPVNEADSKSESPHISLARPCVYVFDRGSKTRGGDGLRQINDQGDAFWVNFFISEGHVPNRVDLSVLGIEECKRAEIPRINA